MPPIRNPLANPKFGLNAAGIAGFLGGDEAIAAMATVHLYNGRRWVGWFNSPGSYAVAKALGKIANTRFWNGLFPGPRDPPAVFFGLDGKEGPEYVAALSATKMRTGHLAYLAMERSKELNPETLGGRVTTPYDITYLAMEHVDYDTYVKRLPLKKALCGLPIIVSLTTCVMCALVYDWFSFSTIFIGIISNGCTNLVIGRGRLDIRSVREPSPDVPPGHGILIGKDGVMVIKGDERDVNAITRGRFALETNPYPMQVLGRYRQAGSKQRNRWWRKQSSKDGKQGDEGERCETVTRAKKQSDEQQPECYQAIGVCSLVLLIQSLLQFLLIPQGTLFGQVMFLTSLCVSWVYTTYLSSLEKERIQAQILFQALGNPQMRRFRAGTRTTAVVFVCLLLFHEVKAEEIRNYYIEILEELLPNKTQIWIEWKERVANQLGDLDDTTLSYLKENDGEPQLLKILLQDTRTTFGEYFRIRDYLPVDSTTRS